MNRYVRIKNGIIRPGGPDPVFIRNEIFPLVTPLKTGAYGLYLRIDVSGAEPYRFEKITNFNPKKVKVSVDSQSSIELVTEDGTPIVVHEKEKIEIEEENIPTQTTFSPVKSETEEEARARIKDMFDALDDLTVGATEGKIRGMVVCGPPGIGKTYGIENHLDFYQGLVSLGGERDPKKEKDKYKVVTIIKGHISPQWLYRCLYDASSKGSVVLFDDCDTVLEEEASLNMLKAVLDSGKKRIVSWMTNSRDLKADGIPSHFEFKGSCIFVTNLNLANPGKSVKSSKKANHLAAILSRCHYIDLNMSRDDIFLRIQQIVEETDMLREYGFGEEGNQEIIDYMLQNKDRLVEVSLRTVLKIAELRDLTETKWRQRAEVTCMKRVI